MAFAFTLTSILCSLLCGSCAFSPIDVKVTFDGGDSPDFKVYLSGVEWLRSGAVGIRDSGQLWSTDHKDKYLLKVVSDSTTSGTDVLGEYDSTV